MFVDPRALEPQQAAILERYTEVIEIKERNSVGTHAGEDPARS